MLAGKLRVRVRERNARVTETGSDDPPPSAGRTTANHRPALQSEVACFAREVREMQISALETILDDYGIDRAVFPPALVAATMQGLAFAMTYDQAAGFDTAPDEASLAMERLLDRLEAERTDRLHAGQSIQNQART